MEIGFSIFFVALSMVLFLIAIYEEKSEKITDEDQTKSDHTVIIFLFLTVFFLVVGGISMMFASESYYSSTTDQYIEVLIDQYRPIGYALVAFCFIPGLMLISKVFEVLFSGYED